MENRWKDICKKAAWAAAAGIGLYFVFRFLVPLTAPFMAAFFIVRLLYHRLEWLQRRFPFRWIKKELLLGGLLVLTAAAVLAAGGFVFRYLLAHAQGMSESWEQICAQTTDRLGGFLDDCCGYLGLEAGSAKQTVSRQLHIIAENLQINLIPGLVRESWWYVKKMFSAAAFLGVGFIASLLLCRDYENIRKWPGKNPDRTGVRKLLETGDRLILLAAAWLKVQAVILPAITLLGCVGLWIGRIPSWFCLGLLAGVLDMLPFIGTGIVLLPTALWQLINGRVGSAVWCALLYLLCALVREFLEPRLMGRSTGISPFFMLLGVYTGVKLFGLWGILEGPLAVVLLWELLEDVHRTDGSKKQGPETEN